MAPPRRGPADNAGGNGKGGMPSQRNNGNQGGPSRSQNGSRTGFRTDTAISNNRPGQERQLKAWVPEGGSNVDGSLEGGLSSQQKGAKWDQFAANENLFGLTTDYNENYYTTALDHSHPQFHQRKAMADRAAREIESSVPTSAHVAEERIMDLVTGGDDGQDEEDKYSGVRRQKQTVLPPQDFPPLVPSQKTNKYTPPARRAPAGQSGVTGAPVDPAIISAQIKASPRSTPLSFASTLAGHPAQPAQPAQPANRPAAAATVALPQMPQIKTPDNSSSSDKAAANKPVADKLAADKPAADKPVADKPAADKLAADKPAADKPAASKPAAADSAKAAAQSAKPAAPKAVTPSIPSSATMRNQAATARGSLTPAAKPAASSTSAANSPAPASATEGVETAVLNDFRNFAVQERLNAEKVRSIKIKADNRQKLQELKKFASTFKLTTPVPTDLIPIIAKDPAKQNQIKAKALQNAELSRSSSAATKAPSSAASNSTTPAPASTAAAPKPAPSTSASGKVPASTTAASSSTAGPSSGATAKAPATPAGVSAADAARAAPPTGGRPQGSMQNHNSPNGITGRHGSRGGFVPQPYRQQNQAYRGDRSGPQHPAQGHSTGHLAERVRNNDPNRYNKNANHGVPPYNGDGRVPPPGPDNFSRRISNVPAGVPGGASGPQKLNPTIHEFRPSPFAAPFNPTGLSVASSPRSAMGLPQHANDVPVPAPSVVTPVVPGIGNPHISGVAPVRSKTSKVSPGKCNVISFIKTAKPQEGRTWPEGYTMRPSFDTHLLWKTFSDDDNEALTYTEYFAQRLAANATPMATPNQGHAMPHHMPQVGHQHPLPLHMHPHVGPMGPRHAHGMPPVPMQAGGGPPGGMPQPAFGADMVASSSQQSYSSPRPPHIPMYPQQMGGTPQMVYNQPVPYMHNGVHNGGPQLNQFRNFGNNQGFMPPPNGQMMHMMPQHFMGVPGGMMPGQQMMYPGAPPFVGPPGAGVNGTGNGPPPQNMGPNGFPSPRPGAAPMMGQQGSQQGQPMYGMSPSLQYQQPAFGPQHQGQGGMRGGYNNHNGQHFGTSPQQGGNHYGSSSRNGGGGYAGKNYNGHNNHSNGNQYRGNNRRQSGADGSEDAK